MPSTLVEYGRQPALDTELAERLRQDGHTKALMPLEADAQSYSDYPCGRCGARQAEVAAWATTDTYRLVLTCGKCGHQEEA